MPPPPMPQVIGNRSKHPAATFATLGRRTGFLRRPFERRPFFRRRGFFRAKGTNLGSKPFFRVRAPRAPVLMTFWMGKDTFLRAIFFSGPSFFSKILNGFGTIFF